MRIKVEVTMSSVRTMRESFFSELFRNLEMRSEEHTCSRVVVATKFTSEYTLFSTSVIYFFGVCNSAFVFSYILCLLVSEMTKKKNLATHDKYEWNMSTFEKKLPYERSFWQHLR